MASPLAYDRLKVSSRMSLWQPFTTLRANAVRYKWKYLVKNQLCSRQVDHTASRQQQIAVVHVTRSYATSDVANNHSLGYTPTLKRSPANCILCSRCSLGSAVSARISATVTWRLTRLAASVVIVVACCTYARARLFFRSRDLYGRRQYGGQTAVLNLLQLIRLIRICRRRAT